MKKLLKLLIPFFLITNLLHGSSQNQDNSILSPMEKQWLLENKEVKVGGEMDWPPFDFVGRDGRYQGISKDIFDLIAEKTGLEPKYITGKKWTSLVDDFKKGDIDILPALYHTKEREKFTLFSDPYFTIKDYAFARSDDKSIKKIEDLKNKKIAIIDGYAIETNLKEKFPDISLLKVKSLYEGIDAVVLKKADVYIDGYAVMMHTLASTMQSGLKPVIAVDFYSNDLHIGTAKNKPVLASIIKKGMDAISTEEKNRLIKKWLILNDDTTKPGFTKTEKEWLENNPLIKIAVMTYWESDNNGNNIHTDFLQLLNKYGNLNIVRNLNSPF